MMAGIPRVFEVAGTPFVNMSFTEAVTNTGYITVYGATTYNDAQFYTISSFVFTPHIGYTASNTSEAVLTKIIDLDFDLLCNVPIDLLGKLIIPLSTSAKESQNGGTSKWIVKLRKYSGSTETDIASSTTVVEALNSDHAYHYYGYGLQITVPLTHYKKGDYIRITIEGWASAAAGTTYIALGHDPTDVAVASLVLDHTIMKAFIPVRVNN